MTRVDIADFPINSSQDTISLTLSNSDDPESVTFLLETTQDISWWKAVEFYKSNGAKNAWVTTQDDGHGPNEFSVSANLLNGAKLVLAKDKGWLGHTPMYEIRDLPTLQGRRVHFLWQRDTDSAGPFVGFFHDLGNAIDAAADAVAQGVETVVETVAEAASTVVETIGTALSNGLDAAGNALGSIPWIGGALRFLFHYAATVTSAAFDLAATLIKAGLDLGANVVAGGIRIGFGVIGGLMAWDGRLLVKGIGDVASGVAGGVVSGLGKVLGLVQAGVGLQMGERRLTDVERERLWRIYRRSIDLYNLRVIDGWTFLSLWDRAPTIGNRIYMGGKANTGDHGELYDQTIVHECCHVWQYKHIGSRYTSDCIWAWAFQPEQGYRWQDYYSNGVHVWQDLNTEAQAEFIKDVYLHGKQVPEKEEDAEFFEDDPIGSNVTYADKDDYTDFARVSIAYVRSRIWFIAMP